jgi:gliding motility-associated-like protein
MNKMNKKSYTAWVLGIIVLIVNATNSYAQPTKTIALKNLILTKFDLSFGSFPNPVPPEIIDTTIFVCLGDNLSVSNFTYNPFFAMGGVKEEKYSVNTYLVGSTMPSNILTRIRRKADMLFTPNEAIQFDVNDMRTDFYISITLGIVSEEDANQARRYTIKIIVSPAPTAPKIINVIPAPPLPLSPAIPPGGKALLQVVDTDPNMNYVWYTQNPTLMQVDSAVTSTTTGVLTKDVTFLVVGKQKPGVGLGAQCGSTFTTVPVFVRGKLFIPNVFAPNGSNPIDRNFRIRGETISSGELIIFNQWGNIVFQTKDLATGWDGKKNGILQPSGVYIYVLKGSFVNGQPFTEKGSVTLIQ